MAFSEALPASDLPPDWVNNLSALHGWPFYLRYSGSRGSPARITAATSDLGARHRDTGTDAMASALPTIMETVRARIP